MFCRKGAAMGHIEIRWTTGEQKLGKESNPLQEWLLHNLKAYYRRLLHPVIHKTQHIKMAKPVDTLQFLATRDVLHISIELPNLISVSVHQQCFTYYQKYQAQMHNAPHLEIYTGSTQFKNGVPFLEEVTNKKRKINTVSKWEVNKVHFRSL